MSSFSAVKSPCWRRARCTLNADAFAELSDMEGHPTGERGGGRPSRVYLSNDFIVASPSWGIKLESTLRCSETREKTGELAARWKPDEGTIKQKPREPFHKTQNSRSEPQFRL